MRWLINKCAFRMTASAAILVCAMFGAMAQTDSRGIRGRVRISSGESIPGVIVDLFEAGGTHVGNALTDDNGSFSFSGLGVKSYTLVFSSSDYQPVTSRIDVDSQTDNQAIEISLVPSNNAPLPLPPRKAQAVPARARELFERAEKLSRAGKADLALTFIQEAIKIFPEYFDAHFAMGKELIRQGKLNEAVKELEQAHRIDPHDVRSYQMFGTILMMQGKFLLAAEVFAEASRLSPTDARIPLMRAVALIKHVSFLDSSKSSTSSADRGYLLEKASASLAQASALSNDKLAAVHLYSAMVYGKSGDSLRAANELERYLHEIPANARNADALKDIVQKLRDGSSKGATSTP